MMMTHLGNSPAPDLPPPRGAWPAAACTLVLALGLYAVNLWGGYVYDDAFLIRGDPRATEPGQWTRYFHERYQPAAADPLWRPLVSLSFVLHNRLHGETAWPAHAVNMLLHGLAAAAVGELARQLTGRAAAGWLAGLLFAAHPVHVEAVAMVVGRAEIMATLGVVGGLLLYLRPVLEGRHIAGIALCFGFALLSKEHGILLGPLLLAWEAARRRCGMGRTSAAGGKGRQWLFVVICALTVAYIRYRESWARLVYDQAHLVWTVNPIKLSRGADGVLVPLAVLGRYTQLLLCPYVLSPDYGADVLGAQVRWHEPWVYVGMAAVVTWAALLGWAWRRRALVPIGCLLSLAIAYGLISNLVYLIGTIMGERLIYLASVFFLILVAAGLARLPRKVYMAIAGVILALACVRTVSYAWRWNDAMRLWTLARIDQPRSVLVCYQAIEEHLALGNNEEAEQLAAEARRLAPGAWKAWAISARVARRMGKTGEVNEYVRRAMEIEPTPPQLE